MRHENGAYLDFLNLIQATTIIIKRINSFYMKRVLTGVMAAALSVVAMGQSKVYLSENFDNGIPSDFVTIDRDENPVATFCYKNVSINPSWIANVIDV